jgi:DNA-binding IclR family transcriptional regulator
VLRLLRAHAPLTAADLVAGCRLSPQVVQRTLLRLARAGLAGHHTHHR